MQPNADNIIDIVAASDLPILSSEIATTLKTRRLTQVQRILTTLTRDGVLRRAGCGYQLIEGMNHNAPASSTSSPGPRQVNYSNQQHSVGGHRPKDYDVDQPGWNAPR